MNPIDIMVEKYMESIRTPFLTQVMTVITHSFDVAPFLVITIGVIIAVYFLRGVWHTILFVTAIALGAGSMWILKMFFDINRPLQPLVQVFGQSFPSGHATIATIFFGMLMYIFDDFIQGIWRVLFNIACIIFVGLVAFSRIYLGAHWLSDIAGGILLGIVVSYLIIHIFKFVLKKI